MPTNQFPVWKPYRTTLQAFKSEDIKRRYKAIRGSSDCFLKKAEVRDFILSRDNQKCCECGDTNNLTIDHIVSVYRYARDRITNITSLNSEANLRVLCNFCNAKKTP